ncbi:MAG: hypothetical protein WC599_02685 [Bacteroidales bacterium]
MLNSNLLCFRLKLNYTVSLKQLAFNGFFLFVLISELVQSNVPILIYMITRIFLYLSVFAAVIICFYVFRNKNWLVLIIFVLLFSKIGRTFLGDYAVFQVVYTVFLNFMFCAAGAAVALKNPKLVYKQVLFFCLFSLFMMILQIAGVGAWTQILSSQTSETGGVHLRQTLFVPREQVTVSHLQYRPSGLTHSNNLLTMIGMLCLGLHFGRIKTSKLTWGDVIVCSIVVLAAAKLLFVAFIVFSFLLLIFGGKIERKKGIKFLLLFVVLMAAYAFFFPAVFALAFLLDFIILHAWHRLMEFIVTLKGQRKLFAQVAVMSGKTIQTYNLDAGGNSAYTLIAPVIPYLLALVLFMVPWYVKGFRKIKAIPRLKESTIFFLLVLILLPIYPSFYQGQFFWFIAGFALMPLFVVLFFKKSFLILAQEPVLGSKI